MMEKLVLNLPLKEIMIRKVVIRLWSVDESFDLFLLEKFRLLGDKLRNIQLRVSGHLFRDLWLTDSQRAVKKSQEWREAFEKVKVKVTELGLPVSLEKKMMLVVKPVGLEMLRGKMSLLASNLSDSRRDVDLQILKQLRWTNAGALDYRKTAENVVRLETLDVVTRFRFACLNFLVDRIPDLWESLPEKYRERFDNEGDDDPSDESISNDEYYWYYTLNSSHPELNPSVQEAGFEFMATRANKAAIKYFFRKLSEVERDSCLCSTAREVVTERFNEFPSNLDFFPRESFSGVLFYLLSEMSREEVEQVFKEDPCHFLGCFLDWPLQDLLPDIADVVWPCIPESKYEDLCNIMDEHFESSGYYFPDVFQKFFVRSPVAFRKFFFEHDCTFISEFVNTKDADTIGVMIRSFDVEERVELISYNLCSSGSIFNKLVMDDDWDFVKLCLRMALESAGDRDRVRRTFMDREFLMGEDSMQCKVQKWKKVFESLEEDDASAVNKRSSVEKASTRVKKPRTEKKSQRRN